MFLYDSRVLYYSAMNNSDMASEITSGGSMFSLLEAAHRVEARVESALATVGLSMPKFSVLNELVDASEPLALSELANRLSCVRSNITQLVDRLEADGLVTRVDDPADRRSVRAALTSRGRERHAEGVHHMERIKAEFEAKI